MVLLSKEHCFAPFSYLSFSHASGEITVVQLQASKPYVQNHTSSCCGRTPQSRYMYTTKNNTREKRKKDRGGTDQKEKVTKTEREGRKEGRKRANKQRCVQTTASSGTCFYRLMNGKFANL